MVEEDVSVIRVGPVGRIVRLNVSFNLLSAERLAEASIAVGSMLKSPTMYT